MTKINGVELSEGQVKRLVKRATSATAMRQAKKEHEALLAAWDEAGCPEIFEYEGSVYKTIPYGKPDRVVEQAKVKMPRKPKQPKRDVQPTIDFAD